MDSYFWNTRYATPDYAYGTAPNAFLQEQLTHLPLGQLLFPCDGEGRNGVYAATLGHQVFVFDLSEEGQRKANHLAQQHNVSIDYIVGEFQDMQYPPETFDCIVMIYAHLPATIRKACHQQLINWLKPGGRIILEGFSEAHTTYQTNNPHAGGPKDISMLYNINTLAEDFKSLNIHELVATETTLNEGPYHNGPAAVIRMVASKPTSQQL
jgi:hypothetical protein